MAQKQKRSRSTRSRRRERKYLEKGQIHIASSFNNTMVTVTDVNGNVMCWASAGQLGFKGSRKSTPFAAQQAAEEVARQAMEDFGLKQADVFIKGPGSGKEAAVRSLQASGIEIGIVKDVTPHAHNGTQRPKRRGL